MITRLVPIQRLIRKVVDDFNLGTVDIPWESMVDWVAYGLQHISAYDQFEPKTKKVTIKDYSTKLPGDFYRVDSAKFHEPHKIQMDQLIVGFKEGTIDLHYLALAMDADGFPLIPDSTEYFNALFWLIVSKLILRGDIRHPEISFQYADERWTMAALSARADANMPDIQGMQRRANDYRRLKFPTNPLRDGFSQLGHEEDLRRDGNR